jgi:hypothetical protein
MKSCSQKLPVSVALDDNVRVEDAPDLIDTALLSLIILRLIEVVKATT